MKRQDEKNYGGLREAVLDRDERRLPRLSQSGEAQVVRSSSGAGCFKARPDDYAVHACHAIVERTQIVLGEMSPLLLILWREKHPRVKEQVHLPLDLELPKEMEKLTLPVEVEDRGAYGDERLDIRRGAQGPGESDLLLANSARHHRREVDRGKYKLIREIDPEAYPRKLLDTLKE